MGAAQPTSPVPAPGTASTYEADLRWILIAEDDDDIRQLIRESIEREAEELPIRIVEAKDGAEALAKTDKRQFHCVITDLNMPKSTGEEFIRALQSHPLNATTPALIVSAYTRDEFKDFCERYSHIKMIPKPCEPSEVAQAVLREIRLGRLDDRVAIHLLNPFLNSVQELLKKDLDLTSQLLQPGVKRPNEGLVGDVHCTMIISTGLMRARFCLSFDKSLLDLAKLQLKSKILQMGSLTIENVARYIVQTVFDRTLAEIQIRMGGQPRLGSLSIVVHKDTQAYIDLLNTAGVTVVVKSEQGRVCAGALSQLKTNRG